MTRMVHARYDGEVLRFVEPVTLPPDAVVWVMINEPDTSPARPYSFLDAALEMDLQGPPDWSERIDEYLYGARGDAED